MATAVDLVWVFDAATQELLQRTGRQWFAEREGLRTTLGSRIAVVALELPPGTALEEVDLPEGHERAVTVVVYGNLLAPGGMSPLRLDQWPCTRIIVARETVSSVACK